MEVLVERCAGLEVHQKTVTACVRSPGDGNKQDERVREFTAFTSGLRELRDWLKAAGVSQVAMDARRLRHTQGPPSAETGVG
jgi:hypothetical protein